MLDKKTEKWIQDVQIFTNNAVKELGYISEISIDEEEVQIIFKALVMLRGSVDKILAKNINTQ